VIADRPCQPDELRSLFLFEKLTPDQLTWLCGRPGRDVRARSRLHRGRPGHLFLCPARRHPGADAPVGSDDIEVNRTSDPGVYAGAFQSYLGERAPKNYNSSLR